MRQTIPLPGPSPCTPVAPREQLLSRLIGLRDRVLTSERRLVGRLQGNELFLRTYEIQRIALDEVIHEIESSTALSPGLGRYMDAIARAVAAFGTGRSGNPLARVRALRLVIELVAQALDTEAPAD